MQKKTLTGVFLCLFVVSLLLTGCGEKAAVTTMITTDAGGMKALVTDEKGNTVALEEIESLVLTVTQIILVPGEDEEECTCECEGECTCDCSTEEECDCDCEGECTCACAPDPEPVLKGNGNVPEGHVLVYGDVDDPPFDLDLMSLVGVAEIVNTAEIPAGTYKQIRLSVENPRMVLVGGDPDNPLTNIKLTANGRLFCTQPEGFTFVGDMQNTVLIDLGGIHLVETGSGKYVFTPQLRATVEIVLEELPPEDGLSVIVTGEVLFVDEFTGIMILRLGDASEVRVDYLTVPALIDPPVFSPIMLFGEEITAEGAEVGGIVIADAISYVPSITF